MSYLVAALYRFHDIADPQDFRNRLHAVCSSAGVIGTLLVAPEGLNGTIAGSRDALDLVLDYLRHQTGFENLEVNESDAEQAPFLRLKVKLKREIVTLDAGETRPAERTGTYVEPEDWNALIARPEVLVVDTRNQFEYRVGHFEDAVDPNTSAFTEFPAYVKSALDPKKHKHVAMYCTGGIRCEKATALLLEQGFENVYHLHGGILRYLERVPESQSRWKGECFVFDQRVALGHGLRQGEYELCFGCRNPLSAAQRRSSCYEPGVSCEYCIDNISDARRQSLRERMRQIEIAQLTGIPHMGDPARQAAPNPSRSTSVATGQSTTMLAAHARNVQAALHSIGTLYSARRCPDSIRARLALLVAGIDLEIREVKIPKAVVAPPDRAVNTAVNIQVPRLECNNGVVLAGGLEIMLFALARHDPFDWLAQARYDCASKWRDDPLIRASDHRFRCHLQRYKFADSASGSVDENNARRLIHRDAAAAFVNDLEVLLAAHRHLYGPKESLADIAIAPFINQFANIDPDWFREQYPAVERWRREFRHCANYQKIMRRLHPWRPSDPPLAFQIVFA